MLIYAKVDGTAYQFERPAIDSREFQIGSWAKFCPHCLEGWAHMSAVDNGIMKSSHCVRGQLCWTCGLMLPKQALYYVPGSLLEEPQMNCQTLDWDLLDYLPRELLLREFKLHDQFFLRQDTKPDEYTTIANQRHTAIAASCKESFEPIYAAVLNGPLDRSDSSDER